MNLEALNTLITIIQKQEEMPIGLINRKFKDFEL